MKIQVRAEGLSTQEGAPILKMGDYTLSMLLYPLPSKFQDALSVTGERINGNLLPSGRIEVGEIDLAIKNAKSFLKGYCPLTEHPTLYMLITLLRWCKRYQMPVIWSKA